MPLTISSSFTDVSGNGLPGYIVTAAPVASPTFESFSGVYKEIEAGSRPAPAITGADGSWSLTLPWPSLSSGGVWQITIPDGAAYQGPVPEGVSGPLAPKDLVVTYGWTITAKPR